jgi:hypothetical protein
MRKIYNRLVSKTYISALLLGLITAVELNTQFLSSLFDEQYRPWLLLIWPVTMMTLREMTNSALNDKPKDPDA